MKVHSRVKGFFKIDKEEKSRIFVNACINKDAIWQSYISANKPVFWKPVWPLNTNEEILNDANRFYQAISSSNNSSPPKSTGEYLFFLARKPLYNMWRRKNKLRMSANGGRMFGKCNKLWNLETHGTDGIQINYIKSFGMTVSPIFLPLLTLPVPWFSQYH